MLVARVVSPPAQSRLHGLTLDGEDASLIKLYSSTETGRRRRREHYLLECHRNEPLSSNRWSVAACTTIGRAWIISAIDRAERGSIASVIARIVSGSEGAIA